VPEVVVALGYLPPSPNATQHRHWTRVRAGKRQLQGDLEIVLMAARLPRPLPGQVQASAVLLVPDRRRRDEGNFRTPLEKALGDALVNGGWLSDDTPEHFHFDTLVFKHEPGVRATRLLLRWAVGR
jgi:hypothetical protein